MASVDEVVSSILDEYGLDETTTTTTSDSSSDLDRDSFLQLLVTQMQYQDPLNPADNQEMLAQLAQFSALEQMENLNITQRISQANDLIDKYIEGTDADGDSVSGLVEGVTIQDSEPYLLVDGEDISIDDVTAIISPSESTSVVDAIDENTDLLDDIYTALTGESAEDSDDSDDE